MAALPFFLFFASCEETKPLKQKEKGPTYYFYEYDEGTIRCHVEKNQSVTCLHVLDERKSE